jgi:hypothetical protein
MDALFKDVWDRLKDRDRSPEEEAEDTAFLRAIFSPTAA